MESDGIDVVKTVRVLSFSLVKSYEFTVGVEEVHAVRIDMKRKLFLSGFRPQIITAWVDDLQVAGGVSTI